ncbi:hypothetical protein PROSTU_00622 [Providencia stuartii ATCC 25827]|uniref:Uncharacterized protein n=1 Tax=Providencia stuartii ATCC 25827 TaxID=471874 RepID=A0AA86YP12_PROST|nr:hypothetical protein PROSTU_00622 [Providencia stuartii ATCC 25827]
MQKKLTPNQKSLILFIGFLAIYLLPGRVFNIEIIIIGSIRVQ